MNLRSARNALRYTVAGLAFLWAMDGRAQNAARFHQEAGFLLGRHEVGGSTAAPPGEVITVTAWRAFWAPGVHWGAPGGRELGLHAVLGGTVSDSGGGVEVGGEVILRQPLGARLQLEGRLEVLGGGGDSGHPPLAVHPGIALVFSDALSLRLDAEFSRLDGGEGTGRGVFAGMAVSGKAATATALLTALAAAVLFAVASAAT